jgi:hypothetical protein
MMVAAVIAVSLALLSALVLAILGIGPGSSTRIIGALIVLLAPLAIPRRLLAQEQITSAS